MEEGLVRGYHVSVGVGEAVYGVGSPRLMVIV